VIGWLLTGLPLGERLLAKTTPLLFIMHTDRIIITKFFFLFHELLTAARNRARLHGRSSAGSRARRVPATPANEDSGPDRLPRGVATPTKRDPERWGPPALNAKNKK
jgi:hypothetical protein